MRKYDITTVDAYIAAAPPESRETLKALRDLVTSTCPRASEGISWGVPFYRQDGFLAGYSAFKAHALFGLTFRLTDGDRKRLEEKGYGTGLKTVKIKYGQKLPSAILREMLKRQAKANADKAKTKAKTAKTAK